MFTEGLDPHALRWIRQNQASLATHQRMDPLRRTGTGTVLSVPPLEKFRSGHLPRTSIPVSHTLHRDSASASGSDMDESSDSEHEIYPSRYSVDSSPREDIVKRQMPHVASRYAYYSSDGYSEMSSSRDTRFSQKPRPTKPDRVDSYVQEQEEEYDSGGSSEFSSQPVRENGGADVNIRSGPYTSSYAPSVASSAVEFGAKAGRSVKLPTEMGTSDVPSAPPIHGYTEDTDSDIRHETDQMSRFGNPRNAGLGPRDQPSHVTEEPDVPNQKARTLSGGGVSKFSGSVHARSPTYHASVQGPWYSIFAYEACVRLCLNSWAKGCTEEAPIFLENECTLLRNSFGLKNILLQPEEELLARNSSELVNEGSMPKPKKAIGRLKVQVRRVRMSTDMPTGCASLSSVATPRLESIKYRLYNVQSTLSSGWESLRRVQVLPQVPASSSFTKHSIAYMHAGAKYIKEVSSLLKVGATTLRSSSTIDSVQEIYTCRLRLKSMPDDDLVPMQPGSGETHVFFPDSLGDDLIMDVYDSRGTCCGRVVAQVASIVEDSTDKVRWWPMYYGPQRELVGRVQLYMNYATTTDDNNPLKCGSIAETVAYDITLEVAMKSLKFEQRNLVLHGSWKWLLTEFASYYGVSDEYARLRYLTYVMDVATPTSDCLTLVHDLLLPVLMKSRSNNHLSHQENRILAEIEEQAEQLLAMAFENYKSLDESVLSGMEEVITPPSGVPAPALGPAVKLYTLLHDILSQEAQKKLCCYFQTAARKRMRRHLLETDEFISGHADVSVMDVVAFTTAYKKVISLCNNTRNEIFTDIEIQNENILPSFVDLPHLAANIYCAELGNRLRAFLVACPPTGPSPPVADLVIATADFQKDLTSWNIRTEKTVDAKELFHLYIILWIEDKRRALVEACRLDEVKWSGVKTKHMTTPFVDNMFDRLSDMLTEYEVIISRWPEYSIVLENAIADVQKAIVNSLEKQYANVLAPLKESLAPKKFGLKYVQKLAKRKPSIPYVVPEELGVLLNSMKRLLDLLLPKVEGHLRSWESCLQGGVGGTAAGERLSEAAVMLRSKFRNYTNAVVEKLVENTCLQSTTKLKKIMKDSKEMGMESDIKSRMQPLKEQLKEMINQLNKVFESQLFVSVCRGFWERMGQDILSFLECRKENRAWFKAAKVTVNGINDTFASKMQELLGNSLKESDLQPPRKIMEVRSILCQDTPVQKSSSAYY